MCGDTATTTPFDGFTDAHIAYAAFERRRNTQVQFGNPFAAGAREGAIWFWMRLTRATEVDGMILDCQGGVRISVNGTFVMMQLNSNERLGVRVTPDMD